LLVVVLCLPLEPVKPFQFFLPRRTGWLIRPTSPDKLASECGSAGQFAQELELRLLVQGGGGGAGDNGVSDITLAQ